MNYMLIEHYSSNKKSLNLSTPLEISNLPKLVGCLLRDDLFLFSTSLIELRIISK